MPKIELTKEEIVMLIGMMDNSTIQIVNAEKVLEIYNKFKTAQLEKE